jgi:hypothetical protein
MQIQGIMGPQEAVGEIDFCRQECRVILDFRNAIFVVQSRKGRSSR